MLNIWSRISIARQLAAGQSGHFLRWVGRTCRCPPHLVAGLPGRERPIPPCWILAGMSSAADTLPWAENSPKGESGRRPWIALWRSRVLIGYLALRDLKLRYRQAALGVIWVLLQPI